jgi:hypothetical protein
MAFNRRVAAAKCLYDCDHKYIDKFVELFGDSPRNPIPLDISTPGTNEIQALEWLYMQPLVYDTVDGKFTIGFRMICTIEDILAELELLNTKVQETLNFYLKVEGI